MRHTALLTLVLASSLGLPIAGQAMDMEVTGDQITLTGNIYSADVQRFKAALFSPKVPITTVILKDSHGGDANTGYIIGDYIREKGLGTAVSGYCVSSCSRMFLGGVRRQISDQKPVNNTYVAFHGNYSPGGGLINVEDKLRPWIMAHLDGKADKALVDRWTSIPSSSGYMAFFHPTLKRKDNASILVCTGEEKRRPGDCEAIKGKTGLGVGVFTTDDILRANQTAK